MGEPTRQQSSSKLKKFGTSLEECFPGRGVSWKFSWIDAFSDDCCPGRRFPRWMCYRRDVFLEDFLFLISCFLSGIFSQKMFPRQKLDVGYCGDGDDKETKLNLQENFSEEKFTKGLAWARARRGRKRTLEAFWGGFLRRRKSEGRKYWSFSLGAGIPSFNSDIANDIRRG